jgi:hypothetical protein
MGDQQGWLEFIVPENAEPHVHLARLRERSSRVSDAGEGPPRRRLTAAAPSPVALRAPTSPASGRGVQFCGQREAGGDGIPA